MHPFIDPDRPHYIGCCNKEQLVDPFGDTLVQAEVNGGDWQRSHNELKILWNGIAQKLGFETTLEACNLFHGIVDSEFHRPYIDAHVSKDAIIPDILIHNYPSDANGNGGAAVPAIF